MKDLEQMFLNAYNLHSDEIFRFIFFKLSDREKAKDMTQETFMKTWLYLSKGDKIENIKAFLYRIARNLVIDEYRKNERRGGSMQSLDILSELGFEVGFDDTQTLIDIIDGKKILALIPDLPDTYSEVIFMKYVEEKSITEISEIISETENTVSVRINRGMKKLKELTEEKQKKYNEKII